MHNRKLQLKTMKHKVNNTTVEFSQSNCLLCNTHKYFKYNQR